jgi:hypothetical protein
MQMEKVQCSNFFTATWKWGENETITPKTHQQLPRIDSLPSWPLANPAEQTTRILFGPTVASEGQSVII